MRSAPRLFVLLGQSTMCLSERHLNVLEELNTADFRVGRSSRETYERFLALFVRCHACARMNNGHHGDASDDCRQAFLRLFISMKSDMQYYLLNGPIPDSKPLRTSFSTSGISEEGRDDDDNDDDNDDHNDDNNDDNDDEAS